LYVGDAGQILEKRHQVLQFGLGEVERPDVERLAVALSC